jgi:hypothetical protein
VKLWLALPAWLRWTLAGAAAIALACLRFFFLGRTSGRAEASAEAAMGAARARADEVLAAAAAGDDAGVQKRLAEAAARAARRDRN